MKQVEYLGEVLADGHLSLPGEVKEKLALKPASQVQVVLAVPEAKGEETDEAWDLFRQMGHDSEPGKLSSPSDKHDLYLYGKADQ